MLRDTERSVLEIAGCFGYDNGSKFSKAFKDNSGRAPRRVPPPGADGGAAPRATEPGKCRRLNTVQTEPYPALSERIRLRLSGILRS